MTSGNVKSFDPDDFEKRLTSLKDTQDSIQAMSAWCLQNRAFHKKVVNSWLTVLKQVKVDHRLTLFYLANDVIQYSKRKNYEFVDSWGTALQRATTMVRDDRVKQKIERIFRIWEQRGVYNEEFLSDLHGLLSINPAKKPVLNEGDDEQTAITVSSIRNCVKLEKETDKCFKLLPKTPLCDTEALPMMKDRRRVEEVEREMNEQRTKLEQYVKSLASEMKSRSSLISVLDQADNFYHNQRNEVKVVVNAYRNFGKRIMTMKRKLEELSNSLPSPIPSPDINAPSPGPADDDFELPGEKDFDQNLFNKQTNGLMGYMDGGALPFDISDFSTTSPKANDTSSHLQSMMTDSYTAVPQPVPPVSSSSTSSNYMNYDSMYSSQMTTPYDQYNQSLPYSSSSSGPTQAANMFSYGQTSARAANSFAEPNQNASYMPNSMQRPAMQMPSFDSVDLSLSEEYNPETWELDWNVTQDSSFSSTLDAPHSPPNYERKGVNTNVIEYIDPTLNENHLPGAGDVDHRQLILPINGLSAIGAKDRNRLVDVDHRNLISLTGSPKLTEKDVSLHAIAMAKDIDFRQMLADHIPPAPSPPKLSIDTKLLPPPSPPVMLLSQSTNADPSDAGNLMSPPSFLPPKFQSLPSQKLKSERGISQSPAKNQNGRDNNESIDMEMSDEDYESIPEFHDGKSAESQDGILNSLNIQLSQPPNFNKNSSLDGDRLNPFNTNSSQEMFNPMLLTNQAQHLSTGGRLPRPLLDIPTGFGSSPRPFMHHGSQNAPDMAQNPFAMNSQRCPAPFMGGPVPQQMNNFRGGGANGGGPMMRANTPYYRNQKGFRNNFRGSNMRGNW